jgi:hypothetical protein
LFGGGFIFRACSGGKPGRKPELGVQQESWIPKEREVKSLQKSGKALRLPFITRKMKLVDLIPVSPSGLPLTAVLSIACFLAAVIVAVIQSGPSGDDDDPGPGDGGLMQPVGAGA